MTLDNLLAAIRTLADVRVALDHDFGIGDCEICEEAPARVRVYGEPAARHQTPIGLIEVCARHAVPAAERALSEQDEMSRSPIRIEVAA